VEVTSSRSEVVAIFGPTASGKTAAAELVAAALLTEVVPLAEWERAFAATRAAEGIKFVLAP